MKKRLTKKWIKRYILPHLKGLKKIQMRFAEVKEGDIVHEYSTNYIIKNGYIVSEGCVTPVNGSIRDRIKRTGRITQLIVNTHNHVFVRVQPEIYNKCVYMRLITE